MNISDKTSGDEYYDALINRDGSYVGTFVVGVVTTGICCLPTCRARKPKRENCEFFPSVGDALRAGYRPCRICRPTEEIGSPPPDVSRALEMVRTMPDHRLGDQDLRDNGISPGVVRRWCKTHMGLTFQGYQRLLRINSAYRSLVDGSTVTDAAFNGGYESLSGFAHSFKSIMQTAPSDAGQTSVVTIERISTPLGPMFAGATDDGLCLLEFTDRRMLEKQIATITRLLKARVVAGSHNHIQTTYIQLQEYFAGTRRSFDIPLVLPGTDFQKIVWESLRTVPYGETWSYARQAAFLGRPAAVRPVAAANGYNRVSIIVPCHRIIGSDGSLTGYGGGLARKRQLLELEKRHRLSQT